MLPAPAFVVGGGADACGGFDFVGAGDVGEAVGVDVKVTLGEGVLVVEGFAVVVGVAVVGEGVALPELVDIAVGEGFEVRDGDGVRLEDDWLAPASAGSVSADDPGA